MDLRQAHGDVFWGCRDRTRETGTESRVPRAEMRDVSAKSLRSLLCQGRPSRWTATLMGRAWRQPGTYNGLRMKSGRIQVRCNEKGTGCGAAAGHALRHPSTIISPLRYPGSKRRFGAYVGHVLRLNHLRPKLFIEPFAGSASVSLQLLKEGLVEKVVLGEKSRLIASFWSVVFSQSDSLIRAIQDLEVDLASWRAHKTGKRGTSLEAAISCIFLNRTSYSGILRRGTGPIGGYSQASRYAIGCRFPKTTIIRRIREASALGDRVLFVNEGDWQLTMRRALACGYPPDEVFVYMDPPFYGMGPRLYEHWFQDSDHRELCRYLAELQTPWLLSYDPAEAIVQMYTANGIRPRHVTLLYSAGSADRGREAQELVITNVRRVPDEARLWQTSVEWARSRRAGQ